MTPSSMTNTSSAWPVWRCRSLLTGGTPLGDGGVDGCTSEKLIPQKPAFFPDAVHDVAADIALDVVDSHAVSEPVFGTVGVHVEGDRKPEISLGVASLRTSMKCMYPKGHCPSSSPPTMVSTRWPGLGFAD